MYNINPNITDNNTIVIKQCKKNDSGRISIIGSVFGLNNQKLFLNNIL